MQNVTTNARTRRAARRFRELLLEATTAALPGTPATVQLRLGLVRTGSGMDSLDPSQQRISVRVVRQS